MDDEAPQPKTVLDRLAPTVVRRRVVQDAGSRAADEMPPSSIFPHPDYGLKADEDDVG